MSPGEQLLDQLLGDGALVEQTAEQALAELGEALELVAIAELESLLAREPGAAPFTPAERAYADSKSDPARRLAARLAAKRAACRALAGGIELADVSPRDPVLERRAAAGGRSRSDAGLPRRRAPGRPGGQGAAVGGRPAQGLPPGSGRAPST
jgi:hypothetical protein